MCQRMTEGKHTNASQINSIFFVDTYLYRVVLKGRNMVLASTTVQSTTANSNSSTIIIPIDQTTAETPLNYTGTGSTTEVTDITIVVNTGILSTIF